ncbi:MAG: hypothetical protein JKY65_09915, partial [Planctomycetes bacterium]|nr:hypothetical protein [Planctomycetota bacterium]
ERADPPAPASELFATPRAAKRTTPLPIERVPRLDSAALVERALLALRAAALALEPDAVGPRCLLIERARRLRRDSRRAPPLNVKARLFALEARLTQELGWTGSAEQLWATARLAWREQRLGFALAPAPVFGGQGAALLPFGLAARVGEVRAASEGIDVDRLDAACAELLGEVSGDAFAPWRAEAVALRARDSEEWPTTPAAQRLQALAEAGRKASPQKGPASVGALRDLGIGEAEAAAAGQALWRDRPAEVEPHLVRAERHLVRALSRGLPPAETARAWAAQAWISARRTQLAPARWALAKAVRHGSTQWEVAWSRAALSAAEARSGEAEPATAAAAYLTAAATAGDSDPARLDAISRRYLVLFDGVVALGESNPKASAKLSAALEALAEEVPLSASERLFWLERHVADLRRAGETERAEAVEGRRAEVARGKAQFQARLYRLAKAIEANPEMGSEAGKNVNRHLIQDYPLASLPLFVDYQRYRSLGAYPEDALTVALAAKPLAVLREFCNRICYATSVRRGRRFGTSIFANRASRRLADLGPPNPLQLKIPPTLALLRAVLHFQVLAVGEDLEPAARTDALAALEVARHQSPRSRAVSLLEAWVRITCGDAQGGREALERARWLAPICEAAPPDFETSLIPVLLLGRSYASEGRYEEAVQTLRSLHARGELSTEWLYWERDFRVQRERWGALDPAMTRLYHSVLSEEELRQQR